MGVFRSWMTFIGHLSARGRRFWLKEIPKVAPKMDLKVRWCATCFKPKNATAYILKSLENFHPKKVRYLQIAETTGTNRPWARAWTTTIVWRRGQCTSLTAPIPRTTISSTSRLKKLQCPCKLAIGIKLSIVIVLGVRINKIPDPLCALPTFHPTSVIAKIYHILKISKTWLKVPTTHLSANKSNKW